MPNVWWRVLSQLRAELKFTQIAVADRMGFTTPDAYGFWERGDRLVPVEHFDNLAKALKLSPDDLRRRYAKALYLHYFPEEEKFKIVALTEASIGNPEGPIYDLAAAQSVKETDAPAYGQSSSNLKLNVLKFAGLPEELQEALRAERRLLVEELDGASSQTERLKERVDAFVTTTRYLQNHCLKTD